MKKFVTCCAALLIGATALLAQNPYDYSGKFNVSVQGGVLFSVNENHFTYFENSKTKDMFKPIAAANVGYDFSKAFGMRVQVGYGENAAAANSRETNGQGFYPYTFKSISAFADGILNISGLAEFESAFSLKGYAGLGFGHSYSFTDAKHPWQQINGENNVFGFRLGGICEYDFGAFGIYADLGGEAYTDMFNGLKPHETDHAVREGYAGFPFDLRATLALGVICHF